MESMARFDAADIRRYYDRHSASFVRFGQGRGSIHRAVWGPGTRTRDDAFHYVEDQIATLIRRFPSSSTAVHVVDLGCGIGASLCYLAEQVPIRGSGITLSPSQAAMAREVVADRGLSGRVECLEGDYCALPASIMQRTQAAFASQSGARVLLIGGPPFPEAILMWWNFVARTPEEIRDARDDWESGRRFGAVTAYKGQRLHAPELVRLARPNPVS